MSAVASGRVESAPSKSASKTVNVALWVAQGFLALAFVAAGVGKLLGRPDMVALYEAIGVGQWFRYLTGILELTGAALVVVPRTRVVGAGLLASIMLGAITTHLFVFHNSPVAPLVLLVIASLVLLGRRAEVAACSMKLFTTLGERLPASWLALDVSGAHSLARQCQ